ncbi:MAG: LLM class flavin-dependent oxidoreductase [Acidimicrobiia bacterium]|nr:LLM class flavin-dependent oxidoreductase [Acidimicrobiia bacterium]
MTKRMLFNAFSMNCVSHIQHGMWRRDDTRQLEYASLDPWLDLARLLERGCFDALFLADVVGAYDAYKGGWQSALTEAVQLPVNDPSYLIPAMATVTDHLGFAFTGSVLQTHPFAFARQLSTLDHLTRGRVAWNIVTSYLTNAARNLGFDDLPDHDERYERADEYLEVLYKLLEGSWEDGAVLRDRVQGVYADPAKVHTIDHAGRFYDVVGPHLCEPSPQRTPLLFQAGTSERGREFAARHAECVFLVASIRSGSAARVIGDVRARAARYGRRPEDIKFFAAVSPVVGGTEAEARAKEADYRESFSVEGSLVHMSGNLGVDLGSVDPDRPLSSFDWNAVQGMVKQLFESAPDRSWTFRDIIKRQMAGSFLTGAPEQIADRLAAFQQAGVDGVNMVYTVTPGTFEDFIDGVVPVLQQRGLMQREYRPGTLREKVFEAGDRLPARHPAGRFRHLGGSRPGAGATQSPAPPR